MSNLLIILLCITFLPTAQLNTQESSGVVQSQSKLAFRFEEPIASDKLTELLIHLSTEVKQPDAKLVVRICSNESLRNALAVASVPPVGIYKFMTEAEGYDPARILLLHSKDCLSSNSNYAATELWLVPKGAVLPKSIESFRACQMSVKSMLSKPIGDSKSDYNRALARLIAVLRKKPELLGVIKGFYTQDAKRPLRSVREGLHHARNLLKQSGISSEHYLILTVPWVEESSPQSPVPDYPTVYTLEILKSC